MRPLPYALSRPWSIVYAYSLAVRPKSGPSTRFPKTMAIERVPLTTGSETAVIADAGGFSATDVCFPALSTLPFHFHERTVFAVILSGSFEGRFPGKQYDCQPATVLTEPAGEKHGNRFGNTGARVLALQPDPTRSELFQPCGGLLERVNHFRNEGIGRMAWNLTYELRHPDGLSPLAIEGIGLEMLACAARVRMPRSPAPPAWFTRAEELLRDRFLDGVRIAEVAREVGVHPVHLARVFRKYNRTTLGAFVRRLRLDWAAVQLAATESPIVSIALRAGFADQSHFTRAFKRHVGEAPGNYRRAMRAR